MMPIVAPIIKIITKKITKRLFFSGFDLVVLYLNWNIRCKTKYIRIELDYEFV